MGISLQGFFFNLDTDLIHIVARPLASEGLRGNTMQVDFASERLLSGENSKRVEFVAKPYGHTLCVCLFGRRLVVDIITRRQALC